METYIAYTKKNCEKRPSKHEFNSLYQGFNEMYLNQSFNYDTKGLFEVVGAQEQSD